MPNTTNTTTTSAVSSAPTAPVNPVTPTPAPQKQVPLEVQESVKPLESTVTTGQLINEAPVVKTLEAKVKQVEQVIVEDVKKVATVIKNEVTAGVNEAKKLASEAEAAAKKEAERIRRRLLGYH